MLISKTPFRVSFFGGGTDYPQWYKENGGIVLSATINKYCYITCRYLPPFFDYSYRIRYYQREEAKSINEIIHPAVRESLKFAGINKGIDLVHHADLPARSGLGSSSTFTVGLLNALQALTHNPPPKQKLAYDAIKVEQDLIGEFVGSQDQTAAAFGGLNQIDFHQSGEITVAPLEISSFTSDNFQSHLMLFFTGFSRTASDLAKEQIEAIKINSSNLRSMMELTRHAIDLIKKGGGNDSSFTEFGKLLNDQWRIKKSISKNISNPDIDQIYNSAMSAGAIGGKLLGAGGGGFILFVVQPEKQFQVKNALQTLLHVPIRFDKNGSQIIYHSDEDEY